MTAHLLANRPAEPVVQFQEQIDDLMLEAKNYLDGEPIANEQQATAVSSLLSRLRRIGKDADEARKLEAKPFDEGKAGVQAKWRPIADAVDLASSTAKQALAPWLVKVEERQREEAAKLQAEADRIAVVAREKVRGSSGNLEARADAELLLKAAAHTQKEAVRADKAKALAKGGERAVGLRSHFTAEITDAVAFGKWAWEHRRQDYMQFLQTLADQECRHGNRAISGLSVKEERRAV